MPNNAVTAKARAVHGRMLTKDDYNVLMHKGTIPAAVAYLKTKPLYASVFADTDEATVRRKQAESLIDKSIYENYLRVCRYAAGDKNGIMSFYTRRLECDQLIKAVIAISEGSQEGFIAAFPEHIAENMCFDSLKLAQSKDLLAASVELRGTMYHRPLAPLMLAPEPDIDKILTTINVCYIKWAFEQINKTEKGKTRERLKDFFLRKADADNLLMCYRLKVFGLENERINELLIPYHKKLRQCEIDAALKLPDPVPVLREMFVTEKVALVQRSDIPEVNVNLSDYRYFRHRLAASTNETESLYSLMILMTAEGTNLCRIIEGLRYGIAPDEIEKLIIS